MKHTLINAPAPEPRAFSGCSQAPAPALRRDASAPPIFVNGVEIPESDIAREAQNHVAASGAEARAAAANALIIRTLLIERGRALGLDPTLKTDGQDREETTEEALVRAVLDAEVVTAEPSEAECRRYYAGAEGRFRAPELYEASHILFEGESAERRAHDAIAQLQAGASFTDLARLHSACPTAAQGGSLGQLTRGDLAAEVEDALMELRSGAVGATPVRTRHGWHVVRLDHRIPARILPFEVAAPAIRETLRAHGWVAAAARYIDKLGRTASIEGAVLRLGGGGNG
ncbi:MAG: peptidylprolyl isomerase [Proteobacteria bacterium]|nr:peptidylprolyl isomerase [Pseudomonadota bacterium]